MNPSSLQNFQFIRNAGKEEKKKKKNPEDVEESLESRKWDNGHCLPQNARIRRGFGERQSVKIKKDLRNETTRCKV